MIIQEFDLNMIPDSAPVVVHVNQYDKGTGRLKASLYKYDTPYSPSNTPTVTIQGSKPDGKGFQYGASVSGNVVTANLTEQMTAVAGITKVQIVVIEANNQTGTFVFFLDVQASALPQDADMSESEYQLVEQLIDQAQKAAQKMPIIGNNGNWYIWSFTDDMYVDSGVNATVDMEISDVTMLAPEATPYVTNTGTASNPIFHLYIPRGRGVYSITKTGTEGLIDTYTITYSDGFTQTYTIANGKSAYQYAVEGGYPDSEEQFDADLSHFEEWSEEAQTGAENASISAASAQTAYRAAQAEAYDSEAYAVGKRNGSPVPTTDPTYQNNSKYYSERSAGSATTSAQILTDVRAAGQNAMDMIEDALEANVPNFYVDLTNGHLYYEGGTFNFNVDATGHLIYGIAI